MEITLVLTWSILALPLPFEMLINGRFNYSLLFYLWRLEAGGAAKALKKQLWAWRGVSTL